MASKEVVRCHSCKTDMKFSESENFDFSGYAGLPVILEQVPAFRCPSCKDTAIAGSLVNAALVFLSVELLKIPKRLPATEARFLRKRLQLTQAELATRIGTSEGKVASWESGRTAISPEHDFILRVLVLNDFPRRGRDWFTKDTIKAQLKEARLALDRVRQDAPRKRQLRRNLRPPTVKGLQLSA